MPPNRSNYFFLGKQISTTISIDYIKLNSTGLHEISNSLCKTTVFIRTDIKMAFA